MKKTFILTIVLMLTMAVHAQHFDWVRGWSGYGGSSDSEVPGNVIKGSVVDSEGNIYVVGEYFPGTKVFGVDPVPLEIATATTNRSIVIAKLNQEGELVWYKGIYNSLTNGGMGNQYVRDIRLVGDTAVMIMANILMPGNNPGDIVSGNILYYLDTLLTDWTYVPWNDSISQRIPTVFIKLGLDGTLIEDHFLYLGALDSAGNPFIVSSGRLELHSLCNQFFDIDRDGNIYITRYNEGSFHIPGLCTDSTGRFPVPFNVTNGGVSALRVIADGYGEMYFTPSHKAAEWNLNIMKFSPHFEELINSVYVFDSTDVYSESDIFFNPSTGVAYKPGIHASSFKIDERNNVYMLLCLNHYGSHMPLSNSDTLAFSGGHTKEIYSNLLIKYDSSLTPQYTKQLRSTYGTDDPYQSSRRFETGSIEVDSETNTIYLTGELQKNYMGMVDNGTVQIYFDSDTLDLENNFFWLRLDRDNGGLVSYGKVQSDYLAEINTNNSSEPTIAVANGKVAATFNYTYNFTFADSTISSGTSYNAAQAMAIWDDMGNEIACHDFNAIHSRNRTSGVYVHDSTLYVTGVVYTGATFGDTVLASTGGRSQAFIAKYVNPIFMQQTGAREQQHIVWNQTLDFSAQPSPIALNATATSGLPVHYASSNPGVAYIDGENLFFAGEGDATVTATQPGNYIYLAAEPVTKPVITPSGHNPGTDGIEEAAGNQQSAVSVYPNPTAGLVYVKTDGMPISDITIHNTMGVRARTEQINGDSNHMTLDLSTLPAGVYYLTVKSGETTTRHKVIKVN